MTISVVVPVYNIESWVAKCIESLVQQTYTDYELILVDDGSKDRSGTICDEYGAMNDKIIVLHKENGGLSDARNYGAAHANGEYLLFIDGDDYVAENALELIADSIEEYHADIVMMDGKYEVRDGRSELIHIFEKEEYQGITGEEALLKTSRITPNWAGWGKAFEMNFWRNHGFEFKKGRLSEDLQLIDKVVLAAKKVSMVPAYYYYCYRSDSIVHTIKAKMVYDMIDNLCEWDEYLKRADISEKLKKQIYAMHAPVLCHSVLGYIYAVESEERESLLQVVRKSMASLKYGKTMECKLIRLSIQILGFNTTCKLLGEIKKRRIK
jgi:glycosyltransferase involved in cell wall biosynthesis